MFLYGLSMLLIKLDVGGQQHEAVEALVFFLFSMFYFAVRFSRWRTAKVGLCRAFKTMAHGKGRSLPCVFPQRTAKRPPLSCIFSWRTAKGVPRRFIPTPSVAFFCRASGKNARQRLFTVRCQKRRTIKRLYHAKSYRVPFAVRLDKKRTAKALPCVFWSLPCASANPEFPVVHLGVLHFFFCRALPTRHFYCHL
jgi:hypothetical protein